MALSGIVPRASDRSSSYSVRYVVLLRASTNLDDGSALQVDTVLFSRCAASLAGAVVYHHFRDCQHTSDYTAEWCALATMPFATDDLSIKPVEVHLRRLIPEAPSARRRTWFDRQLLI